MKTFSCLVSKMIFFTICINFSATGAEDFLNVANINELSETNDWSVSCSLNCYECGENCVGFDASIIHMSRKHGKASKIYRCISCPKSFARKDHLRNHVRRHVFIKDTPSDSQQWCCKQCDGENKVLYFITMFFSLLKSISIFLNFILT